MAITYEPIATTTVSSSGSSVTFSSIPSTYTDLVVVSSAQRNAPGSGGDGLKAQFNGDTGSNYSWTGMSYNVGGTGSGSSNNQTVCILGNAEDGIYSTSVCHILGYSNTNTFKSLVVRSNSTGTQGVAETISQWRSTAAINSIFINCASGFVAGSTFTLYGIKAA